MKDEIIFRFPESPLQMASSYSFTIGHGIQLREKYDGFHIPDFQRPLVWTEAQKVKFVESVILKLPIGSYCYHEEIGDAVVASLLDGQQRWSALFDFYDGKFEVFGLRWSDMSEAEQRFFDHRGFPAVVVRNMSYEQQKDIYERLAYGGTPHVKPTGA